MDEKMNEVIGELYGKLTEEQKAKVKGCKNLEELAELLSEEGIGIPDELVAGVAGGFVWHP